MAVVVVVVLEVVHIEQNQGQPGAGATRPVDLFLQYLVDQAPVAQAGEFIDVGEVGELAAGVDQLAVAVLQVVGQVAQLPGDTLAFPVEGNHVAKRQVNAIADRYQQRAESEQQQPYEQVIGLLPVVDQAPPGDGPQGGKDIGDKILADDHRVTHREGGDHDHHQQEDILHGHRHPVRGIDINCRPHGPGQQRPDNQLPIHPPGAGLESARHQGIAHLQGAHQQQDYESRRPQQQHRGRQVLPEQQQRGDHAHQVRAQRRHPAVLHQRLQLRDEQLLLGNVALVNHALNPTP